MKAKKFHRTLALGAFVMLAMNMGGMSRIMTRQMAKMQMPNITMKANMNNMTDMEMKAMDDQKMEMGGGM
jgi:hypothetical protein